MGFVGPQNFGSFSAVDYNNHNFIGEMSENSDNKNDPRFILKYKKKKLEQGFYDTLR